MINQELLNEIKEFCNLNELDYEKELNRVIQSAFTTLKYGATPISAKRENKPVEVIKTVEVEKIVEVIKEVPVEKIVKVSDDTKINELFEEIRDLKFEITNKNIEIESRKKSRAKLEKELKECEENNKKDIYGE